MDKQAAAELRRLHEENERLREAGVGYSQQTMDAVVREREELRSLSAKLLEALKDMHSGWKYIRETHGDLYGVGWDRAQEKAEAAIARAEEVQP